MEHLRTSQDEAQFRFLAENSMDIICRAGLDRVIRYISPSAFPVLGWRPEELTGQLLDLITFSPDLQLIAAATTRALTTDTQYESATVRSLRKDGSMVWMEGNARIIRDATTGQATEVVVIMRDVSARKALEEQLAALAHTDALTGLPNRRSFDEVLDREWKRTRREGSQISLLLLDLDHFKQLNDEYGHQVGDDCLRAVSAALTLAVRDTDMTARYGGEELAVILPSTDSAGARDVAEKIRSAIEALRLTHPGDGNGEQWVTVSIGIATALARYGGTMRMPEGLLMAADNALYKAKSEGRNRVAATLLVAAKN